MLKSFKTEINPTQEQKIKIDRTIGTCRYVYNFYLAHNKERHDKGERFMSGKSFSVWLNNEYIPDNPGIGIDLGLKDFVICSDGKVYKKHQQISKNEETGKTITKGTEMFLT